MIIGQILIDTKLKVDKNIEIITDFSDIDVNNPTLIVGLEKAKEYNPILDFHEKCFGDGICWTVKKSEKRDMFEEDLYYFTKKCYEDKVNQYNYSFIDFILLSDNRIDKFLSFINDSKIISYKHENMVYILKDFNIFGVDLKQLKYIGKDSENIINKVVESSSIFLTDKTIKKIYGRMLDYFDYQYKYIPLFYYLDT